MKNIIKIAVLLLALLMIVPCLAACNKGGGGDTTAPRNPGGEVEDPYLEPVDLKRYEYKAFVRSQATGNKAFYCEDFWVDPATGGADALSFAVIARNSEIEQTYNCKITQVWSTQEDSFVEMRGLFNTNQLYELTIMMAIDAANCATAGYLSNIKNDLNQTYINLDHEAFDQNSIEQLTLGDSLYYISGDMNISALDNTISTIVNVNDYYDIAEELAITFDDSDFESPYTLVEEGKWTVENMLKIAGEYTMDANTNDGELSYDKEDLIGYFVYQASPLYYYYGAGMRITDNIGGYPQFMIDTDEASEVYDYLFDKLNLEANNLPGGNSNKRSQNFQSGQVLFADYILWDVRRVLYSADIDFAYGILPIPTIEENEDYHSVLYFQNCAHLWALPYKRAEADKAARMMYVMTVYSGMDDSTLDAYYMRTMYMEVAKDDGSRASLEIIRHSLVYDIALLYCPTDKWGRFDELLVDIDVRKVKEFATYTSESRMQAAQDEMNDTIDLFIKFGAD